MSSSSNNGGAHILVIPYPASGHILPHMDLTHHLALRGLTITILVTPKNLHYLNPLLSLHPSIQTLILPFPTHPSVPAGVENMQDVPVSFLPFIVAALGKLYDPLLQWFQTHPSPPVAIISSVLLSSWTQRLAVHLGIKRIGFSPVNAHAISSWWADLENNSSKMPEFAKERHLLNIESWGFIFNSFTELESQKLDVIKKFMKHDRVWAVGPLFPIKSVSDERGGASSVPASNVVAWLDSCEIEKSVVYVGFGSQITLSKPQMEAVAGALEESGVRFIWAVKDPMKGVQDGTQSEVPAGFEDRVAGRGVVIKGWAPQAAILGHRAVGSYLTHCGWNSVLEGVLGGVLLLAWPMQVDHYFNAKLFVDELGAAVRACEGLTTVPDAAALARILRESVVGNRPERVRAMELRNKALDAIKEGGSSHKNLDDLVKQLSDLNLKEETV